MNTSVNTTAPQLKGEWELFRVLQRANLLAYYDTFIQQGGDDVQQLCEAGEEEFLEIMALVGMASKPLHVRRLQKALQEWVTNPSVFNFSGSSHPGTPSPVGGSGSSGGVVGLSSNNSNNNTTSTLSPGGIVELPSTSSINVNLNNLGITSLYSMSSGGSNCPPISPPHVTIPSKFIPGGGGSVPSGSTVVGGSTNMILTCAPPSSNSYPHQGGYHHGDDHTTVPKPSELYRQNIIEAAEIVLQDVDTPLIHEVLNRVQNRKVAKEIEDIVKMTPDHPDKPNLIRKYAAIYGRFDSRRKPGRQLTLHEVTVNEASTQLCLIDPTLLARRDELFPLSRMVIRESGYKYKHGRSRAKAKSDEMNCSETSPVLDGGTGEVEGSMSYCSASSDEPLIKHVKLSNTGITPNKRTVQAELMKLKRQERMTEITDRLRTIKHNQEYFRDKLHNSSNSDDMMYEVQEQLTTLTQEQLSLLQEQTSLMKQQKRSDRYYLSKATITSPGGSEVHSSGDDFDEYTDIALDWAQIENIYSPPSMSPCDLQHTSLTPTSPNQIVSPSTETIATTPGRPQPHPGSGKNSKQLIQHTLLTEGLRLAQEVVKQNDLPKSPPKSVSLTTTTAAATTSSSAAATGAVSMTTAPRVPGGAAGGALVKEEPKDDGYESCQNSDKHSNDGSGSGNNYRAISSAVVTTESSVTQSAINDIISLNNAEQMNPPHN